MPDDETKREDFLSATPQPTRRGKLFVILSLIGVLVVLALGVFTWRAVRLGAAKQDLRNEVESLQAEFAGVDDWQAWYVKRVPGKWGGDAYLKWCRTREVRTGMDTNPDWDTTMVLEDTLYGRELKFGERPSDADLRAFLASTSAFASDADVLLQYDDLSGVPELVDGEPKFFLVETISALNVLKYRADAYACLGEWHHAWNEWKRLASLTDRMRTSGALIEYMVNAGMRGISAASFELLAAGSAIPESVTRYTKPEVAPNRLADLAQSELAFMAVCLAGMPDWEEQSESFGAFYMDDVDWGEPLQAIDSTVISPGAEYRYSAGYIRTTRKLANYSGGELPESEGWAQFVWGKPPQGRANLTLSNLRACLVHALRRHEAAGGTLESFVPDPAFYADYRVEKGTDGWVEIRFGFAEPVKRELSSPYFDINELFEEMTPVRIRPLS